MPHLRPRKKTTRKKHHRCSKCRKLLRLRSVRCPACHLAQAK